MTKMTAVLPQQREQSTYTFASQPRAVQQRKKYRDVQEGPEDVDGNPSLYGNIMYDRRIVRGNTYAQHTLPVSAQPDPIEIQRQQEGRRRAIARKRAKEQLRPKSPDAVEGRKHVDVQTELYLEELSDRVEEADVECQTDAFLDRPPSPLFVPAKSGVDCATQILEGDLFDFDIEAKQILEVLVGKTVEQSLLEVMEEEELANLRAQQRAFEELRNAELVEQQRLEEQERRHREEKERRIKQQREVLQKENETADKIAARAFAQSYLADLVPSVFGTLSDNGYFYDPVERDVEQAFMPWLMERVDEELDKAVHGRLVLDGILRDIVRSRSDLFEVLEQKEQQNKLAQEAAKQLVEDKMSSSGIPTISLEPEPVAVESQEADLGEADDAQNEPIQEEDPVGQTQEGEEAEEEDA